MKAGYWHCILDEESSELTTFSTPYGRYKWLRLPFGLSASAEIFQKHVDQALEGLAGVLNIVDDVLIYGKGETEEEAVKDHDKNLHTLLERCRAQGIALNPEKLKIRVKEVKFMGHILSSEKIKADPEKIQAVREMPKPTNVEEAQRLDGSVNYLAKFLPRLAEHMEPIRRLTRKDTPWVWS